MSNPIDLRSDTLTKPSARMREAMARAEVGDDVFREDPTIQKLEERSAEMFGREAGLFVPSGTMGNLIAIKIHTRFGHEVICERRSHIYNYEMGGMSAVGGVIPHVVDTPDGLLAWDLIEPHIRVPSDYQSHTGLIALENTHNMAGGNVMPTELAREICRRAHERGLPVHLDGARVFNAAAALNEEVAAVTAGFDSVSFCFSKGLGAPVGSMLVGSREFINEARRVRKMLGGGMRQAGILAAAALIALEESPSRLHEDHANARRLADFLAEQPGIEINSEVKTNIVIFDLNREVTRLDAGSLVARLRAENILALPIAPTKVRFVTHCDVTAEDITQTIGVLKRIFARPA